MIPDQRAEVYHAGKPKKIREKKIQDFQQAIDLSATGGQKLLYPDLDFDIFASTFKCAGTDLTLTKADTCIIVEPQYSAAVEKQAWKRVYRIGYKRHVNIIRLLCVGKEGMGIEDTIEQRRSLRAYFAEETITVAINPAATGTTTSDTGMSEV